MSSPRWLGKTLGGRYRVEQLLGQGGMSAVYKAADPNLNRAVAIKLVHPHLADVPEFVDRFREEANVVAQLRHPNIVQVFDFNRDGDDFYMVMEFVAGETLRDRLSRLNDIKDQLPLAEVIKYAVNVCEAADYAHQRSLIHRDIKPANVMLGLEGQAILMDFGIAKIVGGPQYTATGATVGTAMYMSPEQIRGERIDERSDIYSIGVVLFEMISGRPPFQADSPMTMLMMHLTDPVPDLNQYRPECPATLKMVVETAMAKDRTNRYQRAADMSAALSQALANLQGSYQAPTAVGPGGLAATALPRSAGPGGLAATALPRSAGPGGLVATALPRSVEPALAATAAPSAEKQQTYVDSTAPSANPPSSDYSPPEVVSSGRSKKGVVVGGCLIMVVIVAIIVGLLAIIVLPTLLGDEDSQFAIETAEVKTTPVETSLAVLPAIQQETPTKEPAASATFALTEIPSPTTTPESSPTATPQRLGLMTFLDNDQARASSFQVTFAEAGVPSAGSHYALWVSDGQTEEFLGIVDPGSGINIAGEGNENLLALYDRAFVTLESDDHDGLVPSGPPVFLGIVPIDSLEQIRQLIVAAPESPEEKGFLIGAEEQAIVAQDHAGFLIDSLGSNDLATAKNHAEHVINILAGEENSSFGDLNGDGTAQNPGDGFGVIKYLEKTKEHALLAAEVDGASEEVEMHAEHVIINSDNALAFLEEAVRAAGRVLASDSVDEAQAAAEILSSSLNNLLSGADANGDGVITPIPGEGGILLAYEHALKMVSFEFFSAEDVTFEDE